MWEEIEGGRCRSEHIKRNDRAELSLLFEAYGCMHVLLSGNQEERRQRYIKEVRTHAARRQDTVDIPCLQRRRRLTLDDQPVRQCVPECGFFQETAQPVHGFFFSSTRGKDELRCRVPRCIVSA